MFNFYNLRQFTTSLFVSASSPYLQNVCTHRSQFAYRCAHTLVKFVFKDQSQWRTSLSGLILCVHKLYK